MSTRSSKIYIDDNDFNLHIYHELHDGLIHLELINKEKGYETNDSVNIPLPDRIAQKLIKLLEPLELKS